MKQFTEKIKIETNGINFYQITDIVLEWINKIKADNGLLNISILHTSASLLIQENADNTVLDDLKKYFSKLVPYEENYTHNAEGDDDMPAHIRTALTNTNLTLSILNKKLMLGTWQGIFLFEHRLLKKNRLCIFHYIGK